MNFTLQSPSPTGPNLQNAATAEPTDEIFDRYADSVIGCYADHYDAIEVHGVRDVAAGSDAGTGYEIDNIAPTSFSVYAHLKSGGLDCVGDFGNYAEALRYGAEVSAEYCWPMRNFVLDQHRMRSLASLQ